VDGIKTNGIDPDKDDVEEITHLNTGRGGAY